MVYQLLTNLLFLGFIGIGLPVTQPTVLSSNALMISLIAFSPKKTSPSVKIKISSLLAEKYCSNNKFDAYGFPTPGSGKNSNFFSFICSLKNSSTSGNGSQTTILKSFFNFFSCARIICVAFNVDLGSL